MTVLIAGAGIAGLTLGLTLNQIGVPFRICESVKTLRPLGVGINIQPNAVRELLDLGLSDLLDDVGVKTRDYGFFSKFGHEIWVEPRGTWAGYTWPQYSVHRGKLQIALYRALIERAGSDCVVTGRRATGFRTGDDGAILRVEADRVSRDIEGSLLVACDGINSAIRAQMYPEEGDPIWQGAVLWRATSKAPVFRSGASMILAGHDHQRIVAYPITAPDADGMATINWLAELRFDPKSGRDKEDWNRQVDKSRFADAFADWRFDWLDVPALIDSAEAIFEYPMVDRDPLPSWTDGRVTLMGDAAHPTYPVGSNGASQAIIDARVLGAQILEHGVSPAALEAYESALRPQTEKIVLANRGSGPDAIMQKVEDLCGGQFERIEDVIPQADLAAHAARYKALAGFSIEDLNARPPIIPAV